MSQPEFCLGIDPGRTGGIARLSLSLRPRVLWVYPMPDGEQALWELLSSLARDGRVVAVIEQVGGYVKGRDSGKGGGAANGSAMFQFGRNVGALVTGCIASGIPAYEVPPANWQRALGIEPRRKGVRVKRDVKTGEGGEETKSQFKRRLADSARSLFPGVKINVNLADAVLLAEYCYRREHGSP